MSSSMCSMSSNVLLGDLLVYGGNKLRDRHRCIQDRLTLQTYMNSIKHLRKESIQAPIASTTWTHKVTTIFSRSLTDISKCFVFFDEGLQEFLTEIHAVLESVHVSTISPVVKCKYCLKFLRIFASLLILLYVDVFSLSITVVIPLS